MSHADKKKLAKELMEEVQREEAGTELKHPFQDTDFENPFNTCPPAVNNKVGHVQTYLLLKTVLIPCMSFTEQPIIYLYTALCGGIY